MPIKPENKALYPPNWNEISAGIKFGRAGGRCECVGECGVSHEGRCANRHGEPATDNGKPVVLTTAHLDHDPTNCDPSNLRGWCAPCRCRFDAPEHARNASHTRAVKAAAGAAPLFDLPATGDRS
jgi:hypothetical protein